MIVRSSMQTMLLALSLTAAACNVEDAQDADGTASAQASGIDRPKYAQVLDEMSALSETNPTWVKTISYGRTPQGRTLLAVKIADPKLAQSPERPAVLITGATHGDEYLHIEDRLPAWFVGHRQSANGVKRFFDAGGILYVIPIVNPDGFDKGTRENSKGEDLNREFFAKPSSREIQPETRQLTSWLDGELAGAKTRLKLTLDYHCCQGAMIYPTANMKQADVDQHRAVAKFIQREVSEDYTIGNAVQTVGYAPEGTSMDYYRTKYGSLSFSLEGIASRLTWKGRVGEDGLFDQHTKMWTHMLDAVATSSANPQPPSDAP